MKILRTVAYTIALVGGIVLASANMTPVVLVYLPAFRFLPRPEGAQFEAPLALLLLAALVAGTLVAGTGTFVEHLKLRLAVRRQHKRNDKLTADLGRLHAELEAARVAAESRSGELAAAADAGRSAQQALTQVRAELTFERERAEQAERRALAAEQHRHPGADGGASELRRADS